MIDTIGIRILQNVDEVERQIKKQIIVKKKSDGTRRIIKRDDLLKIESNKEGDVTFVRLSLTKFKKGNNFQNIKWKSVINAVDLLTKMIRIDEDKLLLYRVDISCNFPLDKSNNYYLF